MKSRIAIAVPTLLAAGIAIWFFGIREAAQAVGLRASGTVEVTEADLGFQLPGRIAEIGPNEGDEVAAGDTLARLDARELDAAVLVARAQLSAAQARLAEVDGGARPQEVAQAQAVAAAAREHAADATREAERMERLFAGGAVSRQARERAASAAGVAGSELDRAEQALALMLEGTRLEVVRAQEAVVAQAAAGLERALAQVDYTIVVAPFSGRITLRHREPGESLGAGLPVLTLMNPDDRWVRIFVPENRIGAVAIGMAATITADTYPDRSYQGRVVFVGDQAEFTPRNVQTEEERTRLVYPVKILIVGDSDFELKPGIPADVVLETGPVAGP